MVSFPNAALRRIILDTWKATWTHILTRRFELSEVNVDQDKVDDRWAVLFVLLWFEDIALLQTFAVKDFGVDLREW